MRKMLVRWSLGGVAAVAVAAVAVPYVYIHYVEGPPPEKLTAVTASLAPAVGEVAGTWKVVDGSRAGYRVKETLNGQSATAVGRTSGVTGSLNVDGSTVTAATFTVDLTAVTSDSDQRDNQFRGRIMDTSTYPRAVFTLTDPVPLGALATTAGTQTVNASGTLAMHGATKAVTTELTVVRSGATVTASGEIPVTFADYGIDNPSFGSFVKTEDVGAIEVLVKLAKA